MAADNFIFVQIIGFIGTGLFFFSFQCRNNRNLFRIQLVSYVIYTIHLILLGAYTGGISYIINAFRSFCLGSRWKFAHSRSMCICICFIQIAALYFTWGGWISVLPIAANIAATLGGYTHNGQKIRLVNMLVNSPLWIVYNVLVGSWAGILDEIVSEASMIISIMRYGWANLDKTEE